MARWDGVRASIESVNEEKERKYFQFNIGLEILEYFKFFYL